MDFDPAWRARDVLAVVLCTPSLHETHPNRAHLRQFKDGAVAVVHRLKSHQIKCQFHRVLILFVDKQFSVMLSYTTLITSKYHFNVYINYNDDNKL